MKKRLFGILCAILVLALFCGGFAFADGTAQPDAIETLVAGMSLRDKLAQMMFFCPRAWKEDASSDAPAENIQVLNDYTRRYLADHRFGGILLYGETQSRYFVRELARAL